MTSLFSALAIGGSVAAVLLLWSAWRRRHARSVPLLTSLGCWAAAVACWIAAFGAEIGIPLALECAALVAFAFILSRVERKVPRAPRERSVAASAPARGRWWRGTLRGLGAGPLAFAAALGVGVLFATNAPFADSTRLIVAGLLVPSLWAAAMIWMLASRRLWPPLAALAGTAVATISVSLAVAS